MEAQQTKTEMIYKYLTGPRFRHRVQAIVEEFSSMQAMVGMYGDLQGIAGKTLQEIEGLDLIAMTALDTPKEDENGG